MAYYNPHMTGLYNPLDMLNGWKKLIRMFFFLYDIYIYMYMYITGILCSLNRHATFTFRSLEDNASKVFKVPFTCSGGLVTCTYIGMSWN